MERGWTRFCDLNKLQYLLEYQVQPLATQTCKAQAPLDIQIDVLLLLNAFSNEEDKQKEAHNCGDWN